MEFNLDDPLGDILSEGSNDSFFEIGTKKKTSTPVAKASKPSTPLASGKFEDLFGIKDAAGPSKEATKFPEPAALRRIEPPKPAQPAALKPAASSSFNDDDLISDLGFDPKKPKTTKTNILDDILGPMEMKKSARPQTAGGASREESKVISRQSTETTDSTVPIAGSASMPRPKTAAPRRPSGQSSNDPLGLFMPSAKETPKEPLRETPKLRRKGTTADWLGLEPEAKPEKEVIVAEQPREQPQVLTIHDTPQNPPHATLPSYSIAPNPLLLTASNLESQNALQALQQQEAQVALAAQMQSQEVALLEMQQRQQQLLTLQEAQFNSLLQKQLGRQSQLEATIRAQQDRINAHIQMLMNQPAVLNITEETEQTATTKKVKDTADQQLEEVELKAEVKRLELEKLRLEDLVSNVNANHDKEMEFIESSHKKQIEVLEENYQGIVNRLKDEIKNLEVHYRRKLETTEAEKDSLMTMYETRIKNLTAEHEALVKKLKDDHACSIEGVRTEHKSMIENIRQSKLLEFAVIQDNTSYLQTLRTASSHLENVSGDLQTLRNEMYTKIDLTHKEQEAKLKLRERTVEDKERQLKILEETSEQERERLMNLTASLETQLNKLSKETSEEQWTLRQKLATLEVERSAFEREMKFAREQLARDEKHADDLKQSQIDDYQRLMQQVQDEKQSILMEKAKLEAARKLQTPQNSENQRSETEAALQVARDASRQADHERERYLNLQRQMEATKRDLVDEQSGLRDKQEELEAVIYATKMKERRADEALQRSRMTEQNFLAKLQILQQQIRRNGQREAELSQDRLELTRERIELQEFKRKLELTKCSLCRISEKSAEISHLLIQDNREALPMGGGQAVPSTINYGMTTDFHQTTIDRLFDDDLNESLRRMQSKRMGINLMADLDCNFVEPLHERTHSVPTQTVEAELLDHSIDERQSPRN